MCGVDLLTLKGSYGIGKKKNVQVKGTGKRYSNDLGNSYRGEE